MLMSSDNIIYNDSEVFVLDEICLNRLKKLALEHPLKRSRICLHESIESAVQEMIIVAHKSTVIEPHKHPVGKPESYHVLEGSLLVKIYADTGICTQFIILDQKSSCKFYRIKGDVWHQPIPLSEWVVYHEVYNGPFSKDEDVLYAKW